VDYRVFWLTSAQWEILRHLDAYGHMPLPLLLGACHAHPRELLALVNVHEMVTVADLTTGARIDALTDEHIHTRTLWARNNSFGQWAERQLATIRPILAYLAVASPASYAALTADLDPDPDLLAALADNTFLTVEHPPTPTDGLHRRTRTDRPLTVWRHSDPRRAQLLLALTTKGRTYTEPW
jgi:hypothetical protein